MITYGELATFARLDSGIVYEELRKVTNILSYYNLLNDCCSNYVDALFNSKPSQLLQTL
jgi:hypothetical protein